MPRIDLYKIVKFSCSCFSFSAQFHFYPKFLPKMQFFFLLLSSNLLLPFAQIERSISPWKSNRFPYSTSREKRERSILVRPFRDREREEGGGRWGEEAGIKSRSGRISAKPCVLLRRRRPPMAFKC